MNKQYKVIWNAATQTWMAVSELSRAHGVRSFLTRSASVLPAAAGLILFSFSPGSGATNYTNTIAGTAAGTTLNGGDVITINASTGNSAAARALDADTGTSIAVVNGGLTASSSLIWASGVINATYGGKIDLGTGSVITAVGSGNTAGVMGPTGLLSTGANSLITARDVTVTSSGTDAMGIYAYNSATATINLYGTTSVTLNAVKGNTNVSYALVAQGVITAETVNATIGGYQGVLPTTAYGVYAAGAGNITVSKALTLDINAQNFYAVGAGSGTTTSTPTVTLGDVTITGNATNGSNTTAFYVGTYSQLTATGDVNATITGAGGAYGIVITSSGKADLSGSSSFTLTAPTVNGINFVSGNGALTANDLTINANGDTSAAAVYASYAGTAANSLTINGGTLNSTFDGIVVAGGTLNASLNDVTLTNNSGTAFTVGANGSYAGDLELTASGSTFTGISSLASGSKSNIALKDGSQWTMTGNSALTSLTLDEGTLRYGAVAALNASQMNLSSGGGTIDTNGFSNTLAPQISGAGELTKTGEGTLTLSGVNTYSGGTDVQAGALQVASSATSSQANLGTGSANINTDTTLIADTTGAFAFNNALTGEGTLAASNNNSTFNFTSAAGSAFEGTVALANNTFALSDINTSALTHATLQLDSGNITTVGDGNQHIGGLTFNGGKAIFNATVPADKVAVSTITADNLDISGTGTVQVTVPDNFNNSQPVPDTSLSLMEQDDQQTMIQLVSGSNVTGTGGSIDLVDQNGSAVSDARVLDITQDGTTVAEGTYDFGFTAGTASDGLYVNYGLHQVNLLGSGDEALVLTPVAGATGAATDLGAKVIGTGDLAIEAGDGQQVSLSNGSNSYSGVTDVRSGTLVMAGDNVLGQTSALNLAAGTAADMQGYNQSIGALNTSADSQMVISGELTVTDSQRAAGDTAGGMIETDTLAGDGTLIIDPSVVSVNGDQSSYTGLVTVTGGSELKLNSASAFNNAQGIDLVTDTDTLTFGDLSADNAAWTSLPVGTASVALSGAGTVQTLDGADVTLSGDNSGFAGLFRTESGSTLQVSEAKNGVRGPMM